MQDHQHDPSQDERDEKPREEPREQAAGRETVAAARGTLIEPGKFASWIAPPRVGIDNKPGDFEYVKLAA